MIMPSAIFRILYLLVEMKVCLRRTKTTCLDHKATLNDVRDSFAALGVMLMFILLVNLCNFLQFLGLMGSFILTPFTYVCLLVLHIFAAILLWRWKILVTLCDAAIKNTEKWSQNECKRLANKRSVVFFIIAISMLTLSIFLIVLRGGSTISLS